MRNSVRLLFLRQPFSTCEVFSLTSISSPPSKFYSGFLFDMDGTILNSKAAAERVWGRWAENHGLDVEKFLPFMHGKRGIDTIRLLNLPNVDPQKEADLILQGEIEDLDGVVAIKGAADFLSSLPLQRWAIVTSSPLTLAKARLAAAGLPLPRFMVTSEDVDQGKPNPQCYILGAERIGVHPSECLVFEDVKAGIDAGEAAGADVMVISAMHSKPADTHHPIIEDYDDVTVVIDGEGKMSLSSRTAAGA